jgi:hypothetical protein
LLNVRIEMTLNIFSNEMKGNSFLLESLSKNNLSLSHVLRLEFKN